MVTYNFTIPARSSIPCMHDHLISLLEIIHSVSIDGTSNSSSAGDKYTLICNVTAEFTHSVKWLDSTNNTVNDPDITMVTVPNGVNTTSLLLHFDPLKTSHAGTYTCVSTISEPTSIKMATRKLLV